MSTRPLACKYDPILPSTSEQKTSDIFKVLSLSGPVQIHGLERYQHSIPIDPKAIGVPWHSTIPFVRRNIYWCIAEEHASEFFDAIERQNTEKQSASTPNSSEFNPKKSGLIDVAVSFAINLWPDTSERRMRLMVQAMACIFLHDDIKEMDAKNFAVLDAGSLAGNGPESESIATNGTERHSSGNLVNELRDKILAEDPKVGAEFWNAIMRWAHHNETYSDKFVAKYDTLRSYMDYRADDFGVEITDTGLRWGYGLTLSPAELQCGRKMVGFLHDHCCLANDLYSFDKEYKEHVTKGSVLVNAVAVLMELHSLSDPLAAKHIVWEIIRDTENRMRVEYEALKASNDSLTGEQWRYIDAILECAAGNTFCSATIARYGRKAAAVE